MMISVKVKALLKYSGLLTALTCIHFAAEFVHFRLCASSFQQFVTSSGSPLCNTIKGVSALTMEKFITYL
jgi:hypothetical protein